MEFKPLDYTPYDEGMAHTWMGGEPPEAAAVIFAGRDDYPDNVVAWLNMGRGRKEQDAYAKLFAASPDLLKALEGLLYLVPSDAVGLRDPRLEAWNNLMKFARAAVAKAKGG